MWSLLPGFVMMQTQFMMFTLTPLYMNPQVKVDPRIWVTIKGCQLFIYSLLISFVIDAGPLHFEYEIILAHNKIIIIIIIPLLSFHWLYNS